MIKESIPQINELTLDEKALLAQELWDEWAASDEDFALSPEQEHELDLALEEHRRDPTAGSPWEEVRARIEEQLRQQRLARGDG